MARRLTQRLDELEKSANMHNMWPAAWIVMRDGETEDDAIARYEAAEGPIGKRYVIMWRPVTGGTPCPA